tara:strand:- start:476 stop:682 length:207 start_codon:yes stop_codon:yes gene_type:complete
MKWSPLLHGISAIAGVVGLLALFAAWIAAIQGSFLGFSEVHLFNDAKTLLLVSISFGIGTLIHLHGEE